MTRHEAARQTRQQDVLVSLGFTTGESDALRRISLTLHRWAEHTCNGVIERDETRQNRPFWSNPNTGRHYVAPVADRETGAIKRLKNIIASRNQRVITRMGEPTTLQGCLDQVLDASLAYHVQGDPRGAMLYILRPGDVPEGADVDSYYSRGIAIY